MLRSHEQPGLEALRRVPLFATLDKSELETIERISSELDVPQGDELIAEAEPGRQFFVLLEGAAEVRRGREVVNTMEPGDFFGEIALLSDRPTTAAVEAIAPSKVMAIAPSDFRQLLEEVPLLQMRVIQALADRLPDDFYSLG